MECKTLREDIISHQGHLRDTLERFVKEQSEAGTGERMQDYRRLIAAGLGGVSPAEVDDMVGLILEVKSSMMCGMWKLIKYIDV